MTVKRIRAILTGEAARQRARESENLTLAIDALRKAHAAASERIAEASGCIAAMLREATEEPVAEPKQRRRGPRSAGVPQAGPRRVRRLVLQRG